MGPLMYLFTSASDMQLQLHILRAPMCKDRDGGDWDLATISWLCLSGVMFKHPQSQWCYLHAKKKKSVIWQRCLLPNMVLAAKLLRHSAISNQCKKVWGACPGHNHCFPHCQLIWLWFAALECDECLSLKSYSSALTWLRRPRREKK